MIIIDGNKIYLEDKNVTNEDIAHIYLQGKR